MTLRAGGKYCSASGQYTTCNKDEAGLWEIFSVVDVGGGEVGLKALGQYCMKGQSKARVRCGREHTTGAQRMQITNVGGDKVALSVGGRFCSARSTGIDCSAPGLAEAGKFSVSCLRNCKGWITARQVTGVAKKRANSSSANGEEEVAKLKKELAQAKAELQKAEAAKGQHTPKLASLEAKVAHMKREETKLRSQLKTKKAAAAAGSVSMMSSSSSRKKKDSPSCDPDTQTTWYNASGAAKCVGWEEAKGARCGLSERQQKDIAQSLKCPVEVGITRRGPSTQVFKQTTVVGLNGIFSLFNRVAQLLNVGEKTMPSDECCSNFPSFSSPWTDKAIAQCCAKTPLPGKACYCGGKDALKAGKSTVKKLSDVVTNYTMEPDQLKTVMMEKAKKLGVSKVSTSTADVDKAFANTIWRQSEAFTSDHASYDAESGRYSSQGERDSCVPLWPASRLSVRSMPASIKYGVSDGAIINKTHDSQLTFMEWKCANTPRQRFFDRHTFLNTPSSYVAGPMSKTFYSARVCLASNNNSQIGKRCLPRDQPIELDKDWGKLLRIKLEEIDEGNKLPTGVKSKMSAQAECKMDATWAKPFMKQNGRSTESELGAAEAADSLNTVSSALSADAQVQEDMAALTSQEMKDLYSPEFKNALGAFLQSFDDKGPTQQLQFEDAILGEHAAAKFGGRQRRRFFKAIAKVAKKAVKHVKKAAKVVHKHVKKAAKTVVKHVKKGLKAVGKFLSGAAMKLFNKALNGILKLIPQPWRNILKKGLPKIFKKDFKGFLLIHEVKGLIAKIVTGFVPKLWKPFMKPIILKGLPEILSSKIKGFLKIREVLLLVSKIVRKFVPKSYPFLCVQQTASVLDNIFLHAVPHLIDGKVKSFLLEPKGRVLEVLAGILQGFLPPKYRNQPFYLGLRKKYYLQRIFKKGAPLLMDKHIKQFLMLPEMRVVTFIAAKQMSIKFNSGAGAADNWAKAMHRWIPMLLNTMAYGKPDAKDGPVQVVKEFMARIRTLVLEPVFTARLGMNFMWFECEIRKYFMPLFNKDYQVTFTPLNFNSAEVPLGPLKKPPTLEGTPNALKLCRGEGCDELWATKFAFTPSRNGITHKHGRGTEHTYSASTLSSMCKARESIMNEDPILAQKIKSACDQKAKHCKANLKGHYANRRKGAGFGPQKIVVTRQLRTGGHGKATNGGWHTLDVCQFEFSFDVFRCKDADKNCGTRRHIDEGDGGGVRVG